MKMRRLYFQIQLTAPPRMIQFLAVQYSSRHRMNVKDRPEPLIDRRGIGIEILKRNSNRKYADEIAEKFRKQVRPDMTSLMSGSIKILVEESAKKIPSRPEVKLHHPY